MRLLQEVSFTQEIICFTCSPNESSGSVAVKYPSAPRKSAVQASGDGRKTASAPKTRNDSDLVNLEEGGGDLGLEKKQVQAGSDEVEIDGTKEVGASGDTSSKVARKLTYSSEQKGSGGGGNLKVGADQELKE